MAVGVDGDPTAVLASRRELVEDRPIGVPQEVDLVWVDLIEHPEPLGTILEAIRLLARRLPERANVIRHGTFLPIKR